MNEVGTFIKNKREEAKFTQQSLAKACAVHDSTINRIESGKRNIHWDELCKISTILKNFHPFEILLVAGYISESDINPENKLYRLDELDEAELKEVQQFINFLIFKQSQAGIKEVTNNAI